MNIPAIAKKAAALGFAIAESVTAEWSLKYGGNGGAYNAALDTTSESWAHTDKIHPVAYKPSDPRPAVQDEPAPTKALAFPAAELSALALLDERAVAVDPEGVRWQVVDVSNDPAAALVILKLRR